ncbi:hypothetical protein J8J40_30680, partial [Mycobacterium tuberculosis]|nr:hypothetical protein [Mycobacterium tuberculosis]
DRPEIVVRRADPAGPEAAALIAAQIETLNRLVTPSGRPGYDPAADAADPRAVFVLAEIDGQPVGCGALRPIDAVTAEIKRVYAAE